MCVCTNPYSPEQNGKIERLWQSFEKMTTSNPFSIIVFRNNYNNLIPNRALNYKTPLELFTQLSHWKPNLPIEGTLTPNGSFSMGMIQKVGTSFNHVGGFQ